MEIDIYQQCPCHDDKKIKFCCGKDIVSDLNQILAKNKSGQPDAALSRIERAIEKHGPKDCLLTLQTHILISRGQVPEARESNERFRENNPKHHTGLQQLALILLAEGQTRAAVNALQDSMEALTGDMIPIAAANVFRIFAIALAQSGNVLSSRAHLNFAISLKPDDDELKQILFQTYRFPELPMLLKKTFLLAPVAAGETGADWAKKYRTVLRVMDRGQFRKALRGLKKLNQMQPDRPEIESGIALLHTVLCNEEDMAEAWRDYSRNKTISHWDRVEAEAIAQLVDSQPAAGSVDIVRATYEIDRLDAATEIALSSERLVTSPEVESDVFEEGPAPRAAFFFLDKPAVNDAELLTKDNVPCVDGEVLFYGKQTDRAARIECIATRNGNLENLQSFVGATFNDFLSGDPQEMVLGNADRAAMSLTWNWHLPKAVRRDQHAELVEDFRRRAVVDKWSNLSFDFLGGKTPRAAAADEGCKVALDAMLLNLEQSADSQISGTPISQILRDELNIEPMPLVQEVEVDSTTSRASISPVRQQYLDFANLSDEMILQVHSESVAIGNIPALQKLVPVLIERESLHSIVPLDISYSMLAEMTADDDQALEHLATARNLAKERGQAIGGLLVQELEQRMSRGISDKLPALLERIQRYHLKEPNVEHQLARVLQRFGLLDGEGNLTSPAAGQAELGGGPGGDPGDEWSAAAQPSGAQPSAAQSSGAEEEPSQQESKLWLPPS